jgi:hypothetical protein
MHFFDNGDFKSFDSLVLIREKNCEYGKHDICIMICRDYAKPVTYEENNIITSTISFRCTLLEFNNYNNCLRVIKKIILFISIRFVHSF